MLVLHRKKEESILIGNDISITVVECSPEGVRLAIDAPRHMSILRNELSAAAESNKEALSPSASSIQSLQSVLQHGEEPG